MAFKYQNGILCGVQDADGVPDTELKNSNGSENQLRVYRNTHRVTLLQLAKKTKLPFYLYDLNGMVSRLQYFKSCTKPAFMYYAMKANNHLEVLKNFCKQQVGVDVVSGGEILIAKEAGFCGRDMIFSGVGKTEEEITLALKENVSQINVESVSELKRIADLSQKIKQPARVAFRINPNVPALTHPYIRTGLGENKFGCEETLMPHLLEIVKSSSFISLCGLSLHIGSQLRDLDSLKQSIYRVQQIYKKLQEEFCLETFDVGGGLGIDYTSSQPEDDLSLIKEYGLVLKKLAKELKTSRILTEPGRIIVGRFGCLIGEVQYIKKTSHKNFVILNTGMNHLIRPCLYQAYHRILPLEQKEGSECVYDVAGPVCESSDVIGRDRVFCNLKEGDFLAIMDVGAYGRVMANTYNSFSLPKELIF